jgi:hypothetical protein
MQLRDRGSAWHEALAWYLNRGDGELDYKLKAIVPSFIQAVSEPHMFRCTCRPPIVYEGHEHARMMHFAVELEAQKGSLRAFSPQDDYDLVNMPLICCEEGELRIACRQYPGFDEKAALHLLDFLPGPVRASILKSAESALWDDSEPS